MSTANTVSRRTAALWLLISSLFSICLGYWIEISKDAGSLGDFRAIYYGSRIVIDHHDPYNAREFLQTYLQDGGTVPTEPERKQGFLRAVPVCVNLPTTLLVVSPLALLPWTAAHYLWMTLMPLALMLSAWLIWDLAGERAPRLTLFLLCLVMSNCQVLLILGNGSGLAVSLCVAAVWCFVKQRYEALGVLCFTLGLALKPQEVGLIWLFLLLAGGIYRRRAWQVFAAISVLVVVSVVWVSQISPHWIQEWQGNVAATTAHGDLNDPGPAALGNKTAGMIVSLQSVISYFWDDPHVYNPAAWLLAGIPILIWCVITLRARLSEEGCWLAIASMAALSLLPIYHRQYDVKLLLLTIPACAVLWAQGGAVRKLAAAATTAGILLTSDIPVSILFLINKKLNLPQDHFTGQLVGVILARASTLGLVLAGSFYLWAYLRHVSLARAAAPVHTDSAMEVASLSA